MNSEMYARWRCWRADCGGETRVMAATSGLWSVRSWNLLPSNKKRTYTKRLAANILEQLKEGDILNVSRINDIYTVYIANIDGVTDAVDLRVQLTISEI